MAIQMLTWEQEKEAAKANGRDCSKNNLPCTNMAYMNNQELADLWLAGWEEGSTLTQLSKLSKEEFMTLQKELEGLEMTLAKGEETANTDARMGEIERQMNGSRWEIHPDKGCIEKID